MDEKLIRNKIHRAVDVHGASMQDDPHLAQRIITQTNRKEVPRMKKLSTGMIIAIALMLLSATAVAVGLTVEEMWRQSFAKMNTTGIIRNYGEPGEDELSTEEAIALARKVIQETYGTPDEELDSMGLYPTFHPREVDDGTEYPSEWKIYYSSRTGVDLDYDDTEHGPLGEYRVYINAETGEITYRHWYTNDFWPKAQQVWDCGSYDEVYWEYTRIEFFDQSAEDQRYWTAKLAEKGYAVVTEEESLRKALLSAQLELQFCELSRIADNTAPQVAAAWQTLEESTGMKAETLQKYAYVATIPDWQTGTDNVCIHFSYELQWDMSDKGYLNPYVNNMFSHINNLGLYMVSFEPGTTEVAAITHISPSEYGHEALYEADGLLAKVDWEPADLVTFDEAYTKLDRAVKRMRAWIQADGTYTVEAPIEVVADDFLLSIGGNPEFFEAAPAEANVAQWFAEESEWDAHIVEPEISYAEFTAQYGYDDRFYPMELMMRIDPDSYRMPREGEMSFEEAIQRALDQLILEKGQEALDELGDYTLNCLRVSLTTDLKKPDCGWEVYITDDPSTAQNGWKITFGEWADRVSKPHIQHITDPANG